MPKLIVEGEGEWEIEAGKRLVLALTDDAQIDQLHACGGHAKCTTCKVEFVAGEPDQISAAEKQVLHERGLSGVRLSCQIVCDQDMHIRCVSRLSQTDRKDCGGRPDESITPAPVWGSKSE